MNEEDFDLVIIGTGPSGIAAAREACIQGLQVLIVDGGLRYNPLDSVQVSETDSYKLKKDFPTKKYFQSDFATREHPHSNISLDDLVGCVPSAAVGGLSSIWGGCILPLRELDMKNWPYAYSELCASYNKVFQYVPIAGAQDWSKELEIPNFSPQPSPSDPLLRDLISGLGCRLTPKFKVEFIESLLAVDNRHNSSTQCIQCGKCLSGCEVNSIFLSSNEIPNLQRLGARYISGLYVTHLHEDSGNVIISGHLGHSRVTLTCKRVAIAAGPIASTALALSASATDTADLSDAQSFTLPILMKRHLGSLASSMSLPTNFVEIICRQTQLTTAHLQIYPHGREMKDSLASLTPIKGLNKIVSKAVFPHAVLAHGFLGAASSGYLRVRKLKQSPNGKIRFSVTAVSNQNSVSVVDSVCKALRSTLRGTGVVPLWRLTHLSRVGGSFHVGASFPISKSVGERKSDLFGRPFKLRRIHLVDASSLPTVPPQSPTITAMAHSHIIVGRIAQGIVSGTLD